MLLGLRAFYLLLPPLTPCRPILHDPVQECTLEADVVTGFFAFDPLVTQDLLALGQELLIEHRIFHQLWFVASLYIWRFESIRFYKQTGECTTIRSMAGRALNLLS